MQIEIILRKFGRETEKEGTKTEYGTLSLSELFNSPPSNFLSADSKFLIYVLEMPSDSTLAKFEELLSGLKNTDLLIMMDVSQEASQLVENLSNISSDAVACMKKFSDNGNSVAVMKFASTPQLSITFDDPCVKDDACLLKKTKDIR